MWINIAKMASSTNNNAKEFTKPTIINRNKKVVNQPQYQLFTSSQQLSLYRLLIFSEYVDPPFSEITLAFLLKQYQFSSSIIGFNITHYGHRFELGLNNFPVFADLIMHGLVDSRTGGLIKFLPRLALVDIRITNVPIAATTEIIKQLLKEQGCTLRQYYSIRNESHTVDSKLFKTGRWRVLCYPDNGFTIPANNKYCSFFPDRYVIITSTQIFAGKSPPPVESPPPSLNVKFTKPSKVVSIAPRQASALSTSNNKSSTVTATTLSLLKAKSTTKLSNVNNPHSVKTAKNPPTLTNLTKMVTSSKTATSLPCSKSVSIVTNSKPIVIVKSNSNTSSSLTKKTTSVTSSKPTVPKTIVHSTSMITVKSSTTTQTSKLQHVSRPNTPIIAQIYCLPANNRYGVASILPKAINDNRNTIHDQLITPRLLPSKIGPTPLNSPLLSTTSMSVFTSTVSYMANKTHLIEDEPSSKKKKHDEITPVTSTTTPPGMSVSAIHGSAKSSTKNIPRSSIEDTQPIAKSSVQDKATSSLLSVEVSANSSLQSVPIRSPTQSLNNPTSDSDLLLLSNCVLLKEKYPDKDPLVHSPRNKAGEIVFNITDEHSSTVVASVSLPVPKIATATMKASCTTTTSALKVSKSTNFNVETEFADSSRSKLNNPEEDNSLINDIKNDVPIVIEIDSIDSAASTEIKQVSSTPRRTSGRFRSPLKSEANRSLQKVVVRSNPIYPPVSPM